ncbi:Transcriptional regulatory protein YpdB [compost metagenome]
MELHIAICDDDRLHASKVEEVLIKLISMVQGIRSHIDIYESGEALLIAMEHTAYHILYLDMEMPGEDGITVAEQIRKANDKVLIIFVTSHSTYMYRSFQVQPYGYLLKPTSDEELRATTVKAIAQCKQHNDVFTFAMNQMTYHLRVSEMMYITVERGKKLVIVTVNETYSYYGKLGELADQLEPYHFCRVHSGYVVNWDYVRALGKNQLILKNGAVIPVSRTKSASALQSYHQFIEKRMLK